MRGLFRLKSLKFGALAALAILVAGGIGTLAQADDVVPDGDGAVPVSAALNPLNFGTVCVGQTYNDTILVAIKRAGLATDTLRVFANSATVTVGFQATPDDSADIGESMNDSSIVLPSNWQSVADGTMSTDTAEAAVSLTPSATGAFSKTIFMRATGSNSLGSTITRNTSNPKVIWTAVNCDADAPAVTHSVGSPSYTSGSDTYVTSSTTLNVNVDETAHGNSGLSSCTVSVNGPTTNDGSFACAEGNNNYTLSTSAPLSLASAPPDGSYANAASATDNHSNTGTDSFTVTLDNTAPSFGTCSGGPYLLGSGGGSQAVSITADDSGSGLNSAASTLSGTVDTSSVGVKTVGYTAKDNLANTANTSCQYSVVHEFHGFFQPVDNGSTFNVVKAGQGIPVKFDLGGDQGLAILATGYPKSFKIDCSSSADLDSIESTVTAGASSLNYDATVNPPIGQYIYVWKSEKSWAATCRQLDVKLNDGTIHSAKFSFTR